MTPVPAPAFADAFARTLHLSPFVRRATLARPSIVTALEASGAAALDAPAMQALLDEGHEDLGVRLRRLRQRVMVTLAHRDLAGLASLAEVFDTMSALADVAIGAAWQEALARTIERHGPPQDGVSLTVMALGKLGGGELNVSSDVDLVFLYACEGETTGARGLSHREFFAAAGRALIALLAEPTAEGQVFRVDMRLRPFGDSGPLATSLAALEEYFVTHARPWERYAWVKARCIAGPTGGLAEIIDPFVYRRYLDYGMLDALREMHGRIFEAAVQRRKAEDIKVGRGGIREVEFAVQLFQLVRGGRDAALRTASTREALSAVADRGLLERGKVDALEAAYAFLRKLEHRLQYYDDQQTQALPRTPEHQALIAEAMDFADYAALEAALAVHRENVQAIFAALFAERTSARPETSALMAGLFDPQAAPDPEAVAEALAADGIVESAPVARRLIEFTRSRRFRNLSAGSRSKVERLVPVLVAAVSQQGGTEVVAQRLIDLLEAIDRRDAYYALLVEHPQVLERAARLMARSAWMARLLARHPILLDELTRSAANFTATDWAAERRALVEECLPLLGDTERLLDHLRHTKQREVLRLAIADLEGELPVMALSDELTALADMLLDVTVAATAAELKLGPGLRRDDDPLPPLQGFSVVGYGKLGGKELGYGSDLDIVFLYDETLASQLEQVARLAQRVNTWMTSLTPAGVLYDIDLRLRPDGAKGLLVSSFTGFEDYQRKRAWTWEHQALTRARAVAGDPATGQRFEALRDALLAMPRERGKLLGDILAMRKRMRAEQKAGDLKHVEGGMIDLEFAVQALVLAHGPEHAGLRENKGNHTLLRRAAALGLVAEEIAVPAANAYLAIRRRIHEASLNDEETVKLGAGEMQAERDAVQALWREVFGAAA